MAFYSTSVCKFIQRSILLINYASGQHKVYIAPHLKEFQFLNNMQDNSHNIIIDNVS